MNRKARRSVTKAPAPQQVQQLVGLCRAQRFAEAAPLAREFTRKWPGHAVGWHALAACMQAQGNVAEAVRAHRQALKLEPENADGHNNLGLLLLDNDMAEEAAKSFRRAVRIRPRFTIAHYNLGLALEALGRLEEAADEHRRAVEIQPDFAAAHNQLGNVLHALGRHDEAAASYQHALELEVGNAEFHSNLAMSLTGAECNKGAEKHYREALSIAPDNPGINNNFGLFLAGQYRWDEAEEAYGTALAKDFRITDIHVNMGNLLRDRGRRKEAEGCYREAIAIDSSKVQAWTELGHLLMDAGDLEDAEKCHRQVCKIEPESATAWRTLANALAMLGRRDEAIDTYGKALEIDPRDGESWYRLLQVKPVEQPDYVLEKLTEITSSSESTDWNRMYGFYALGKAYADLERSPESVIECYRSAGQFRIRIHGDRAEKGIDTLQSIMQRVDTSFIENLSGAGDSDSRPIFIIGMPRSGTTLVEQILASHPDVHGAGERYDFERAVLASSAHLQKPFPECLEDVSAEMLDAIGHHYRQAVLDQFPRAGRVTDKMPNNFRFVGLIALALPNARIVHIEREPADTCLSCFERPIFGEHPPAHDLVGLGRYYQTYARLMDHWRSVLPPCRMMDLRYDQLVTEPESSIRAILDHCDLPWDDRCLRSHETRRAVATASLGQVRQPIYTGSLGRWMRYREALQPLFEALGPLAPDDTVGEAW